MHVGSAAILIVVALGAVATLGAWSLSRATPAWWPAPDPADPAAIASAESLERRVSNELSLPRTEGASWTVEIGEDAATAWLNVRLPRWLANHDVDWPQRIGAVAVDFRPGRIVVGAEVDDGEGPRIVGAAVEPGIDDDGALAVAIRALHVGDLAIPGRPKPTHAERLLPPELLADAEAQRILRALIDGDALAEAAEMAVDDARLVRLRAIEVDDGVLRLTCVTEPRGR